MIVKEISLRVVRIICGRDHSNVSVLAKVLRGVRVVDESDSTTDRLVNTGEGHSQLVDDACGSIAARESCRVDSFPGILTSKNSPGQTVERAVVRSIQDLLLAM